MKTFVRFTVLSLVLMMVMGIGMATVTAQDENILVFAWEQEPSQLSPMVSMTWGSLMQNFYQRDTWDWDVNREIFPVMATEIPTFDNGMVVTLENGNTQVTYKLREGMLWSDGEAITAEDCQWWHDRIMMDPTSGTIQRDTYPEVVESFETIDDYTFVMTYNVPWPDYLNSNTATCGYPQHILEPQLDEFGILDSTPYFNPANVADVVAYGPYVFEYWDVGNEISFMKNANWDGNEPAFDRLVLRQIPESAQIQNAFEVGDVDIAFMFSDDLVEGYQAFDGAEVFSTPGVYGDAIWMNYGNNDEGSPLEDVNIRMAIVHAIDRGTLAEELIGPGTDIPKSWLSSQFWPEDLGLIEYDPVKAEEMLDAAGYPRPADDPEGIRVNADGQQLIFRFFTTTRQLRMDYQVFIESYLADVGIKVQLMPIQAGYLFDSFLNRGVLKTGSFDLAIFALSSGPLSPMFDADSWYGCSGIPGPDNTAGNNGWGFCSPEFDEADVMVGTTVNPDERMEYAYTAQREFFNAQFWHGLYLRPTWYAFNTDAVDVSTVGDLGTLSSNYFNHIEDWQPAN
jgi:peptide/nickel transport system substrate-binding protein